MIIIKTSFITDQLTMDFERALYLMNEKGFEYIEIHSLWNKTVEELNYKEVNKAKKLIDKYNLKVSCLSTTLFLMCPLFKDVESLGNFSESFITFEGNYKNHVEGLRKCFEYSKILNTDYIRIFPFRKENDINLTYKDIIGEISELFSKPAKEAQEKNKILVIENCPYTYLPKGLMTNDVVKKINLESLQLLWDIGNSFKSPSLNYFESDLNIFKEYKQIKNNIGYCHIKDFNRINNIYEHITFGKGIINYPKLLKMFKEDKFDKFLSLEPEVSYDDTLKSIKYFFRQINKIENKG